MVVAMAEAQKEAWVAMAAMVGQAGRRSAIALLPSLARRIGLASGSFRDKCTKTTRVVITVAATVACIQAKEMRWEKGWRGLLRIGHTCPPGVRAAQGELLD